MSSDKWIETEKKKIIGFALCAMLYALCSTAAAQQPGKVPRIGFLFVNFASSTPARYEAFRQGLRELGYVEGKNIFIEWRSAEGNADRLPSLAAPPRIRKAQGAQRRE